MFQEAYHRLQANRPPPQPWGPKRVFTTVLTLFLIIYLAHAQYLFLPNFIHHQRWRLRGPASYSYTISKSGLLPPDIQAGRRVVVKDGAVAAVTNIASTAPAYRDDIESVDGMLNQVYPCMLLFPLLVCSFEYEPFYGYPTQITVNCPIPDACYTHTRVTDMELHSP